MPARLVTRLHFCTRQPVKPVTPRVLLLGSSNTRGATVGIKEDIKSVGAFGVTVSPDVTVVSDRYGGFVTHLAPSLTPPRVMRPLSSEVAGVDGGMLERERLGCADCVR